MDVDPVPPPVSEAVVAAGATQIVPSPAPAVTESAEYSHVLPTSNLPSDSEPQEAKMIPEVVPAPSNDDLKLEAVARNDEMDVDIDHPDPMPPAESKLPAPIPSPLQSSRNPPPSNHAEFSKIPKEQTKYVLCMSLPRSAAAHSHWTLGSTLSFERNTSESGWI